MKKIAPAAIALSLVAAFTLASPNHAQEIKIDPDNRVAEAEQLLGVPGILRDRHYQQLLEQIGQLEQQHETRRAEIAAELKAANENLSDEQIALQTDEIFTQELKQQLAAREGRIASQEQGAPYTDLPDQFANAVRGCTVDGYIYRLAYNFTVNEDDVFAMFQNMTRMDPDATLGVTGTTDFLEVLKTINDSAKTSMTSVVGPLIDEASKDIIDDPAIFSALLNTATSNVTDSIQKRHGIRVIIETDSPKEQGGRCAVAPESQEHIPEPAP